MGEVRVIIEEHILNSSTMGSGLGEGSRFSFVSKRRSSESFKEEKTEQTREAKSNDICMISFMKLKLDQNNFIVYSSVQN